MVAQNRRRHTQYYRTLNNLYGRPIMTLRVDIPREITRRGHSAVNYASGYLMAAAVIVVTLLVVILNRVVLSPLALVTRHAVAIGEGKDLSTRLNFKDRDEIGVLAHEFDRMVARVAESHRQLIDQSFHAGMAEVATNVLHNVGNILNSVNISASLVAERVRQSKASGVSRLAALLRSKARAAAGSSPRTNAASAYPNTWRARRAATDRSARRARGAHLRCATISSTSRTP